jgi:hypothetical protein
MELTAKLFGRVRLDRFGRIVVDTCPSDYDHLRDSKTDPATGKPTCRHLLEDALVLKQVSPEELAALGEVDVEVTLKLTKKGG